ncbi:unnamed protein product, partial [Ectocarpus sp. 6 AP-2014]
GRQNQVLDSRRNKTVTVEPAEPFLSQSVEIAMVISRLLIIGLGVLWILALLLIGGAFGADAASVPLPGSANADPEPSTAQYRMSMLKEGLELHLRGEHAGAARTYSRLLEVMPKDPDGLHLLGLSLYSQGMILRGASEGDGDSQGMQDHLMLVRSAISVANSKKSELSMRSNLGEILRAKGDLEEAEAALRIVVEEQEATGVRDHQASFNLAVTLVDIIRRNDSSRRHRLVSDSHAEDLADEMSENNHDEWLKRWEAEYLLKLDLSNRPDNLRSMLDLVVVLKSNWDLDPHMERIRVDAREATRPDESIDGRSGTFYNEDNDRHGNVVLQEDEGQQRKPGWGEEALVWLNRALLLDPSDASVALEVAVALHRLGRTEEARGRLTEVLEMEGGQHGTTRDFARSNLAVLKQESGDIPGAIEGYRAVLAESPKNCVALNNLGVALLALSQQDEGLSMLEKSFELDPFEPDVLVNLGIHWQEDGDLDRARSFYTRQAAERLRRNDGLPVRRAIMLQPIMAGEREIAQEIEQLERAVDDLIARDDPPLSMPDPARGVERVHFYLVYRGGNYRLIQQKIARMYTRASPALLDVTPDLEKEVDTGPHQPIDLPGDSPTTSSATTARMPKAGEDFAGGSTDTSTDTMSDASMGVPSKTPLDSSTDVSPLRVGFVSKFFGDEASEPHGMLLEGVVKYLPRRLFRVIVCPIDAPGKRLSPSLADAADEVMQLPVKLDVARRMLGGLRLDVLVYADMNSEPISHFLGYSRLARVQAVFWGNPITTGNPSIDYFVSAEVMEGQHRTALSDKDEPYSEQVVLLGGQGIWYARPVAHDLPSGMSDPTSREAEETKVTLRRKLKSKLGVEEDSVIFMCSQSLFKLKPDFDLVLRDILLAVNINQNNEQMPNGEQENKNKAYLVLTEGRRKLWTEAFWRRLSSSLPEVLPQVKILPRMSAGKEFRTFLASADVILHPFPFGGSKTAADGLALGVPVVAMEGDALPGRMAFSLYKTMGLERPGDGGCCIARSRDSYVELAVRLGRDAEYRRWAGNLIGQRSSALWERRDVLLEWARFLSRAAGRNSPTAEEVVNLDHGADLPLPPAKPFVRQQQQQLYQQREAQQHLQKLYLPPSDESVGHNSFHRPPEVRVPPRDVSDTPGKHNSTASGGSRTEEDDCQEHNGGCTGDDGTGHANGSEISIRNIANSDAATAAGGNNTNDARSGSTVEATDRGLAVAMAVSAEIDNRVDATTGTDEDEGDQHEHLQLISHLLERFAVLYGQSRLEEAAITSQQTLRLMEGMRSKRREKVVAAAPTEHKSAENMAVRAEILDGANENMSGRGADDKEGFINNKGVGGWGESRRRPADIVNREHVSLSSGGERGSDEIVRLELEKASAEASAIAGVMNDLGCTLQQLWRLDEAESMLRGAIENRPGYHSAMTSLGATLQAKDQLEEAEVWLREALRLSPLDQRDEALASLVQLIQAGGGRRKEAVDLIVRETSMPPLHQGGTIIAVLSLLQPRPIHRHVFRKLEEREGWSKAFARPLGLWDETKRLREVYPLSTNIVVTLLGFSGRLGGALDVLRDVAGMEPLFSPEDEKSLLPRELHTKHQEHHRPYDRHSVHMITQYYVPEDPHRAREINVCLLRNIQNPIIGTVHIFTDHPDAVRQPTTETILESPSSAETARHGPSLHRYSNERGSHDTDTSCAETDWRPPVLRRLNARLAGKVRVVRTLNGRRMTFRDAFRYSNDVLDGQVVLLSNSDIMFDESLARLGDPSTLDMANKVFALAAWQNQPSEGPGDDYPNMDHGDPNIDEDPGAMYGTMIGDLEFTPRTDSQDSWIFRSPLPPAVADAASFEMGRPRCDGRLAQVLIDAGYVVTSPSLALVTRHVHGPTRHRPSMRDGGLPANDTIPPPSQSGSYRLDTQVPGATASVLISDQWLF